MGGEWREVALGELVDLFDGPHATPPKTETGPVFLGISNLANGRLNLAETEHLSESDFVRWTRRVEPQPGDVVFSYETRLGEAASIPRDLRCCLGRRMGLLRPRPGAIDNRFLLYAYLGPQFQDVLRSRAVHGSTVDRIPLEQMPGFPIRVPVDLSEQRAIAHILGTLDDKIELNRRMSETLEAMARALFKSWFVDFLPVRAKMAAKERDPSLLLPQAEPNTWYVYAIECNDGSLYIGQTEDLRQRWLQHVGGKGASWTKQHPPVQVPYWEKQPSREAAVERENWLKTGYGRKWLKHEIAARTQTGDPVRAKCRGGVTPPLQWPQHILDLFPARLVDSELGEIPEGWEVKPIGDLAEVVGGSTPKTERTEYWVGGTHHWVTPKDLSGLSMPVLLDTERKITDAGLAQISSGLLPKGTVLLSSRAPIGYLAIAEVPVAVNQGFIAMKPRPGTSNLFLLRWASAAHDEIVSHANGSTFLEISKSSFRPIRIVAPSAPVMDTFDRATRPMYLKVVEHERESRTLAALRDALLPKLISGELRVKDAERFLKKRGL
jgi:restriction endonuclease S subunit